MDGGKLELGSGFIDCSLISETHLANGEEWSLGGTLVPSVRSLISVMPSRSKYSARASR